MKTCNTNWTTSEHVTKKRGHHACRALYGIHDISHSQVVELNHVGAGIGVSTGIVNAAVGFLAQNTVCASSLNASLNVCWPQSPHCNPLLLMSERE